MTALHPAGSDREGQSRKNLWPPPEGSADPILGDRDPLVKMLIEIAATQDGMLEDHLLLVNRVGLHSCSDYCLRTPRHPEPGLQPRERVCRMEFGGEFRPGKKVQNCTEIVEDHNKAPRLEMPRGHRLVQHSCYQLQSWRADGDVVVVVVVSGTAGTRKVICHQVPSEVGEASVWGQWCNTGDHSNGECCLSRSRQYSSQLFRNPNRGKVLQ